jgi:hypothetical protein
MIRSSSSSPTSRLWASWRSIRPPRETSPEMRLMASATLASGSGWPSRYPRVVCSTSDRSPSPLSFQAVRIASALAMFS